MRNYDVSDVSYLMYLNANSLYEWAMSQKRPVDSFEWVEDQSQFNERFIKSMMKTVINDIFLK